MTSNKSEIKQTLEQRLGEIKKEINKVFFKNRDIIISEESKNKIIADLKESFPNELAEYVLIKILFGEL